MIQWLAPAGLVLMVIAYELGPAHWLSVQFNSDYHFLAEILFYGTLGPGLTFVLLLILRRWLEERETSDLQAEIMKQAQDRARESQAAIDDAVQTLFAASVILASLESKKASLTSQDACVLHETRLALDNKIEHLRKKLLEKPSKN
ncbi:MAG TPA: hypothetical protein VF498_12480 [Anaerolineales bacterium]